MDAPRRAVALTTEKRQGLVAAIAAVDAELAAGHSRRTEQASPVLRSRVPG